QEQTLVLERRSAPTDDPFAYLVAGVRGEVRIADSDLSSLGNNVIVMRILEAARQSAATGKTVKLAPH
ncbi:MAG: Gfo/Idh/MocA family protein, partial [Pyrinomonadaceae bacterium]